MNVACSKCGAKYRIDPSKINGPRAWFKCRSCDEKIIVEPEVQTEAPDISADTSLSGADPVFDDSEDWGDTVANLPGKSYRLGLTAKVSLLMLVVSLIPGGIFFALSSKSTKNYAKRRPDQLHGLR